MSSQVFDINQLFCELSEEHERNIFGYVGYLSPNGIDSLLTELDFTLDDHVESRRSKKKIFSVLVEILQNLSTYVQRDEIAGFDEVLVCINKSANQYILYVGNFLQKKQYKSIESRIKIINTLTNEQLRQLYRSILDYGSITKTGGAGLGLIDIAKRSDEVLLYQYEEINQDIAFFTLKIVITG